MLELGTMGGLRAPDARVCVSETANNTAKNSVFYIEGVRK
jgi:hypothetical protein